MIILVFALFFVSSDLFSLSLSHFLSSFTLSLFSRYLALFLSNSDQVPAYLNADSPVLSAAFDPAAPGQNPTGGIQQRRTLLLTLNAQSGLGNAMRIGAAVQCDHFEGLVDEQQRGTGSLAAASSAGACHLLRYEALGAEGGAGWGGMDATGNALVSPTLGRRRPGDRPLLLSEVRGVPEAFAFVLHGVRPDVGDYALETLRDMARQRGCAGWGQVPFYSLCLCR